MISPSSPPTGMPTPLRIKRLSLTDFRAFPGPAPAHFDLDSKNLLIYGENGSGKSSIFHAFKEIFSLRPTRSLREYKNVFSSLPETDCKVAVEFSDGNAAVEWTISNHPGLLTHGRTPDTRITEAALRRACLDYRALLDTNYKQGNDEVNLFSIAVEHLLRDFPVPVAGGTTTNIGELWVKVRDSIPICNNNTALTRINEACLTFNTAFRSAFPLLIPHINQFMELLRWNDVEIRNFNTPGLTYNNARLKQNRAIDGQKLTLDLYFRKHNLATPQLFLNEARLSALGLSIYLAGRLACTPTTPSSALKLLVLDDVLIGLDHSNRRPVLNVLNNQFADWQIVLLTHDRNWFDLARLHLPESKWKCIEIYEGDNAATAPLPIIRSTQNYPARALLDKAKDLLKMHYVEAAANYTRQAFELGVRKACELKKIEMRYCTDPRSYQAQDFLNKLKKHSNSNNAPKDEWGDTLKEMEKLKNIVMNPYSHPNAPNIPKQEVEDAISAVNNFLELAARK